MPRLVAVVAALVALAAPARAHVEVVPGLVESGAETVLRIELPQLRPGPPPTSLALEGAGVDVRSVSGPERHGPETRWQARVRVDAEPGPLPLVLRAGFADGGTVEVRQTVTVVPARGDDAPSLALAGVAGALLLVALGVALLQRARRRD